MRKILCALLGVLFSISANAACNLFDPETNYGTVNYDVIRSATGFTATAVNNPSSNARVVFFIPKSRFKPNTTYYFSSTVTGSQRPVSIAVGRASSSGGDTDGFSYYGNITSANGSFTISDISADRPYISFFYYLYDNPNGTQVNVSDIMITEGSTAPTAYTPYDATCMERCKNLLDPNLLQQAGIQDIDGVFGGSNERRVAMLEYIPVTPGQKYVFSSSNSDIVFHSTYFYDENYGHLYTSDIGGRTTTVPENAKYMRFTLQLGDGTSVLSVQDVLNANPQLELGSTATEYVPYNAACHNNKITIATTKYNETAFSPLNTALANAISVVDSVVSNTITQAASIATLQAQKQTRPNDIADDSEKCPAGKKCLLVEDASGVPHWYEIVTGRLPDGYTELEYIESTGTQWIDPDINITSTNIATFKSEAVISNVTREGGSISGYSSPSSKLWYGLTSTSPYEFYYSDGHQEKTLNIVSEFRYYKYVIDAPNGSYSVYTESDEAVASKTGLNFSTSNDFKFYLFTYSPTGTASAFKPQKIKYAKFWFDGTLVRDFVPALNPDGKIGMYDLVGGRFYENAGTGTFIGGQPVFN